MTASAQQVIDALNHEYVERYPPQALEALGRLSNPALSDFLQRQPPELTVALWDGLMPDRAAYVLDKAPEATRNIIVQRADPIKLARVLARLDEDARDALLERVSGARRRELLDLTQYPDGSAGALMDPRFVVLSADMEARDALQRIRKFKPRLTRQFYLVDTAGRVSGMLELHRLALAEPGELLAHLAAPPPAITSPTSTREEVVELLEQHRITDLPVADGEGRLIGIIHYDALLGALREEGSADMLKMVGASDQERALSSAGFVVRKRLPWLSINLVTAFLAASVVGLFESTIAQFTALAVLLPVVAGQSGNTGAQALAVTMRGIVLREFGSSQWLRVARKEVTAAFINGCSIAALTGISVLVWSGSAGLGMVIALSMVIAMVAAAAAGVIIPVTLSALGQDPAQSSSIILTTVTDIVGFFSFLGIATLLAGMI